MKNYQSWPEANSLLSTITSAKLWRTKKDFTASQERRYFF